MEDIVFLPRMIRALSILKVRRDYWHIKLDYHAGRTTDFKKWLDHGSAISINDIGWAADFSVWDGDEQ